MLWKPQVDSAIRTLSFVIPFISAAPRLFTPFIPPLQTTVAIAMDPLLDSAWTEEPFPGCLPPSRELGAGATSWAEGPSLPLRPLCGITCLICLTRGAAHGGIVHVGTCSPQEPRQHVHQESCATDSSLYRIGAGLVLRA